MGTVITGDPTTVSSSLAATITGATNATPIVITTSSAHGFADGDTVVVSGVGGNTAANGTWAITKLTSTTFSLDTSVGSGAYTSGGTATDVSLTPQFTIPDDGDDLDAASVNVALEALADRTQFLAQRGVPRCDAFTASGTWKCPAGVTAVLVEGFGGGGGGGGGRTASTNTAHTFAGGSGGGGSTLSSRVVPVTPGTTYTVTIGAGGTAGTSNGGDGGDGGDSSLGSLATFPGGGKGWGGAANSTNEVHVYGGTHVRGGSRLDVTSATPTFQREPSNGGLAYGVSAATASEAGRLSPQGLAGGAGGAHGAAAISFGGSGGGGGGGGPAGVGGAGGAGGLSVDPTGVAGSAGSAASANTGAGGGGGGAGGGANTTPGAGGAGGAGGSGRIRMFYVGIQAVTT